MMRKVNQCPSPRPNTPALTWTSAHTKGGSTASFSHVGCHSASPQEQRRAMALWCFIMNFISRSNENIHTQGWSGAKVDIKTVFSLKLSDQRLEAGNRETSFLLSMSLNVRRNCLVEDFVIRYMVERGTEEDIGILEEAREEYAKIFGASFPKQIQSCYFITLKITSIRHDASSGSSCHQDNPWDADIKHNSSAAL